MKEAKRTDHERPKHCPRCQSTDIVPIVYGLPGPELLDEARAGKIALGGCCIDQGSSDYQCRACGRSWQTEAWRRRLER